MKISKIIGPPGTGKTEEIYRLLLAAVKKYDPERIGAVSFTKAAVNEMRERTVAEGKIDSRALQHIQTIHSLCFNLAGLEKDQVVDNSTEKIKEWNEDYPQWALPLSDRDFTESDMADDRRLFDNRSVYNWMNIYRNRLTPPEDWHYPRTREFWRDWSAWLVEKDYVDFTGMLELIDRFNLCPELDVLFVDEAQDLTALQLRIIMRWAERTDHTVFAGDSDQAIYRWAGSVPEIFRDLRADWKKTLTQSYRVPREVHRYAMGIITKVLDREPVEYYPRDFNGSFQNPCRYPILSLPGVHMIIARCHQQLLYWKKYLISRGFAWCNPYRADPAWNPTSTKIWRVVSTYLRLCDGHEVTRGEVGDMIEEVRAAGNILPGKKTRARELLAMMPSRFDLFCVSGAGIFTSEFSTWEKPLSEVFNLSSRGAAGELLANMTPENILIPPRVILGTIHSVKGGEADHVWIDTTANMQIDKSMITSRTSHDDEARVAYVAATRAKQTLGLLEPPGYHRKSRIWI